MLLLLSDQNTGKGLCPLFSEVVSEDCLTLQTTLPPLTSSASSHFIFLWNTCCHLKYYAFYLFCVLTDLLPLTGNKLIAGSLSALSFMARTVPGTWRYSIHISGINDSILIAVKSYIKGLFDKNNAEIISESDCKMCRVLWTKSCMILQRNLSELLCTGRQCECLHTWGLLCGMSWGWMMYGCGGKDSHCPGVFWPAYSFLALFWNACDEAQGMPQNLERKAKEFYSLSFANGSIIVNSTLGLLFSHRACWRSLTTICCQPLKPASWQPPSVPTRLSSCSRLW